MPHGEWLTRSQIVEKLKVLEQKVDIWKNIEDFYKVERIVIIESRLTTLEQDVAYLKEHLATNQTTLTEMLPILENIERLIKSTIPEPEPVEILGNYKTDVGIWNPKPAGEFTVVSGIESTHQTEDEVEELEAKIAALKTELGEE